MVQVVVPAKPSLYRPPRVLGRPSVRTDPSAEKRPPTDRRSGGYLARYPEQIVSSLSFKTPLERDTRRVLGWDQYRNTLPACREDGFNHHIDHKYTN